MKRKDDKPDLAPLAKDRESGDKVKIIQSTYEAGRINRREFMAGALAMGVSLTAASA